MKLIIQIVAVIIKSNWLLVFFNEKLEEKIYSFRNVHFSNSTQDKPENISPAINVKMSTDVNELPSADSVDFSMIYNDIVNNSDITEEIIAPVKLAEQEQQFESEPKGISKTRKIGLIFKLASVRGAKSKSMKHKLTTQFQPHTFKSISCDKNCDICQKPLINKKAVECKSKFAT